MAHCTVDDRMPSAPNDDGVRSITTYLQRGIERMTDERTLLSLLKARGPLSKAAILELNRWTNSQFERVKRKVMARGLVITGRGMRMKLAPRSRAKGARDVVPTGNNTSTGSSKRPVGKAPGSPSYHLSADERKLFTLLDPMRVLNKADARRRLNWAIPRFELACAALVSRGLVVQGKGPGGSLRRAVRGDKRK